MVSPAKSLSLAAVFFSLIIIVNLIPTSAFIWPDPPPSRPLSPDEAAIVANITEALLLVQGKGKYYASIPDLVSKLIQHYSYRFTGGEPITVFIPQDSAEYDSCRTGRPAVEIVEARVHEESFGPRQLSNGSILPRTRMARGPEIRVTESADRHGGGLSAKIVAWGLYVDRRVVVHGIGGAFYPNTSVAAVGRFAISGLVDEKTPSKFCPGEELATSGWRPELMSPEYYERRFVYRVDGRRPPVIGRQELAADELCLDR